jgi:hypothetical protein
VSTLLDRVRTILANEQHWEGMPAFTTERVQFFGITIRRFLVPPPIDEFNVFAGELAASVSAGIEDAVAVEHRAATTRLNERIGKWGGATLVEDADPHVRSLGFATLVRQHAPDTAVFNLLGATAPANGVAMPLGVADAPPVSNASLQYRPFENRGLEGAFLLTLPTRDVSVPAVPVGSLVNVLTDVVLEVSTRCCYDGDLAATLTSSRRYDPTALLTPITGAPLVTAALTAIRTAEFSVPALVESAGDTRTIHLSLRAHRDKLLRAWKLLEGNSALPSGIAPVGTAAPLAGAAAFAPLPTRTLTNAVMRFRSTPATTVADLLTLESEIWVTPDLLRMAGALTGTAGGNNRTLTQILELGVAVVPMDIGARVLSTAADGPWWSSDPLGMSLTVDTQLQTLLPGESSFQRRLYSTVPGTAPLTLDAILGGATAATPAITLGLGTSVSGNLLYDVIFSISFRVPLAQAESALGGVQ